MSKKQNPNASIRPDGAARTAPRDHDQELATLVRMLEDADVARQLLAERHHQLWAPSREFAKQFDALTQSLAFRLLRPLLRLMLSPQSLGFGETILDDMARQRQKLPR